MSLTKVMSGDSSAIKRNNRIDFSIRELIAEEDRVDFSPKEYQRYFRASDEWQSQFIKSFFLNKIIIPEFAFRFGKNIPASGVLAEIMDGQQRATTIHHFVKNDIALPMDDELEFFELGDFTYDLRGKIFRELPNEVRSYFKDYELSAMVYEDLTAEQAGHLFVEILNNSTELNAQEKRQAISSAMSRWVQEKSRFKPLKVFETVAKGSPKLKWIHKGEHTRLDVDKCLAEIAYMVRSDTYKTKGVTGASINEFYRREAKMHQDDFKTAHIEAVLNFANSSMRMSPEAKDMISYKQFRNYCVIVSDLMKARQKLDPVDFMGAYIQAIKNLRDKSLCADGLDQTPYELRMRGNGKEDTQVTFDLLWKELSLVSYKSTTLDKNRTFSREVVREAYYDQEGICAICGTEMPEFGPEIHGDHVLLYKDGNPTTPENCDAVHASCNVRK
jgi:hypothetical protein